MTNTKRLGRYHYLSTDNNNNSANNNNDNFRSPSYFNEITSFYKENCGKPLLDLDKPLLGNKHTSLQKVLANANKTIERATEFINKIKSRQIACANRAKSIPENATIRKEYIKCGKEICEQKHGPYYYAYWKDPESKKLKKKYIGDHMPKNKELGNGYGNDNHML
ncbi:MAG: hypothetical protein WCF03_21605 [Nitrososphaeraceae archaeon]